MTDNNHFRDHNSKWQHHNAIMCFKILQILQECFQIIQNLHTANKMEKHLVIVHPKHFNKILT
jgi:hypothetical protein